jgi:dihydroneopterin aldolase
VKVADDFFECSDAERAAFEAGIKLGTIYHQFVGTPISRENVSLLEKAIAEGTKIQPFVEDAYVEISKKELKSKKGEFDYVSLSGNMLRVHLVVVYGDVRLTAGMRFVEKINYPLMFIEKIERLGKKSK